MAIARLNTVRPSSQLPPAIRSTYGFIPSDQQCYQVA